MNRPALVPAIPFAEATLERLKAALGKLGAARDLTDYERVWLAMLEATPPGETLVYFTGQSVGAEAGTRAAFFAALARIGAVELVQRRVERAAEPSPPAGFFGKPDAACAGRFDYIAIRREGWVDSSRAERGRPASPAFGAAGDRRAPPRHLNKTGHETLASLERSRLSSAGAKS